MCPEQTYMKSISLYISECFQTEFGWNYMDLYTKELAKMRRNSIAYTLNLGAFFSY